MSGTAVRVAARAELAAATARLQAAGIETARVDAEWLLADVLGVGRSALALVLDHGLPSAAAHRYALAVARRAQREPLQQIMGWEEFRGLRLAVTPDVLVPRPETEMLVECALGALPPAAVAAHPLVVDVGTGSGCVGCAVAHERADVRVIATELSRAALAVARRNVTALGLAGRVRLVAGDVLAAVRAGTADLVVSNPPYLPSDLVASLAPEVRDHEPLCALTAGADPLGMTRRLVDDARRVLRPPGALVLETAGGDQADVVARMLRDAGFVEVSTTADLTGTVRFVAGRRASALGAGAAGAPAAGHGYGAVNVLREGQ